MHTVYLFNLLYWADSIAGMYPGQKKTITTKIRYCQGTVILV